MKSEAVDIYGTDSRLVTDSPARIGWVDTVRGLGIIAVVCGHVLTYGLHTKIIYFFHMPLFFFLSGYLNRVRSTAAMKNKIINGFAVPYVCYAVLILLLDIAQSSLLHHPSSLPLGNPVKAAAMLIYGGAKLPSAFTVFWFLSCLALATAALNIILIRLQTRPNEAVPIAATLLVSAYLIGPFPLPFAINVVPMAVLLMWTGSLAGEHWSAYPRNYQNGALLGCLIVTAIAPFYLNTMNMKFGDYGTPILTLFASISFIFVIFTLAKCGLLNPLRKAINSLGQAAIAIMFLHEIISLTIADSIPEWAKLLACILLPYMFFELAKRTQITRRLFLGVV